MIHGLLMIKIRDYRKQPCSSRGRKWNQKYGRQGKFGVKGMTHLSYYPRQYKFATWFE